MAEQKKVTEQKNQTTKCQRCSKRWLCKVVQLIILILVVFGVIHFYPGISKFLGIQPIPTQTEKKLSALEMGLDQRLRSLEDSVRSLQQDIANREKAAPTQDLAEVIEKFARRIQLLAQDQDLPDNDREELTNAKREGLTNAKEDLAKLKDVIAKPNTPFVDEFNKVAAYIVNPDSYTQAQLDRFEEISKTGIESVDTLRQGFRQLENVLLSSTNKNQRTMQDWTDKIRAKIQQLVIVRRKDGHVLTTGDLTGQFYAVQQKLDAGDVEAALEVASNLFQEYGNNAPLNAWKKRAEQRAFIEQTFPQLEDKVFESLSAQPIKTGQ
jgi:hypothetical protein